MGCDIHLYIEKKRNGKWVPAQGFVEKDDDGVPDVPYNDRFNDRNYELFGFLAGVRDSENQRFQPKGFPADASKEVKSVFDQWGRDAHTPSYLTLEELKSVDWDKEKIVLSQMFLKDQLEAFRKSEKRGEPNYGIITTWCSWTSMKNWIPAEIEIPLRHHFGRFYDLVYWLNSYDYRCKPNEIRIVFWFDN